MTGREQLAQTFLAKYPQEAAKVLYQLPHNLIADYLAGSPVELSASVMKYLAPSLLAELCEAMGAKAAAAILSRLPIDRSVAILRIVKQRPRMAMVNLLPKDLAGNIQTLLSFSKDKVGAWIQSQVFTLKDDLLAAEARRALKYSSLYVPNRIFVLDDMLHIVGWIPVANLLRAPARTKVASLTSPTKERLMSHTPLPKALNAKDWQQYVEMPVVNKANEFIGILTFIDLNRGISDAGNGEDEVELDEQSPEHISQIIVDAMSGAWQLSLDLLTNNKSKREL